MQHNKRAHAATTQHVLKNTIMLQNDLMKVLEKRMLEKLKENDTYN